MRQLALTKIITNVFAHILTYTTYGATSFSRNFISSNRCLPKRHFIESLFAEKKNITERNLTESSHRRIVELPELHNTERYFSESLFSRTLFSRTFV